MASRVRWKSIARTPSLDFANTVSWHASPAPEDSLTSYGDLLAWARNAGLLTRRAGAGLAHHASAHPSPAARALARARRLREIIYRLFAAIATDRPPREADLAAVSRAYGQAVLRARPAFRGSGLTWSWPTPPGRWTPSPGPSPCRPWTCCVRATSPASGNVPHRTGADGSFSTPAGTAAGAGATWPTAATASRCDGSTTVADRREGCFMTESSGAVRRFWALARMPR